jgi:hypothetical protein
LSICFRVYVGNGNADNPPSPYIAVKYKGTIVASTQIPASQLDTGSSYRPMLLRVDANGKLYLAYGERVLYNGLQLPNYTFMTGKFGFYGRTGGLNENQWFDNILIQATQSSGPLAITKQPASVTVLEGQTATFTVALSDPNNATYQWSRNGTAIGGATSSSYTTPVTVAGDNGASFKVSATGPSGTVTSDPAVLTVVSAITISNPQVSYDFDDGLQPPDTILNGGAGGGYISTGGVNNSGCIHLTDAVNGQAGTFIISDMFSNQPVSAITVHFSMLVGGGTAPPADGFSFVWCPSNDLPSNITFGEDGAGGGLIVGFDIYNNAGEGPAFNVRYHGFTVVTNLVPLSALETGANFGDVYIRVSSTGLFDLQYNGQVIYNQVQLPGYAALAGGEFAFGGRTGGLNENQWIDNIQIAGTISANAPVLAFTHTGNSLQLTWGAGFKLQSSSGLPGTWTDVPTATSPFTVDTSTGTQFYRLAPTP